MKLNDMDSYNFEIEETDVTPSISFDETSRILAIQGRSIPGDAGIIYDPLMSFLNEVVKGIGISKIEMNLEYFNTASHKHLAEMFKKIGSDSENTIVDWYYHIDDDEMRQVGEIFERIFKLKFEFISFDDDKS